MKQISCILLSCLLCSLLTACGGDEDPKKDKQPAPAKDGNKDAGAKDATKGGVDKDKPAPAPAKDSASSDKDGGKKDGSASVEPVQRNRVFDALGRALFKGASNDEESK